MEDQRLLPAGMVEDQRLLLAEVVEDQRSLPGKVAEDPQLLRHRDLERVVCEKNKKRVLKRGF